MAIVPMPAPTGIVDTTTGRLQPLTDQERRARSEALGQVLNEISCMTNASDTDDVWRDVMRGIDESIPEVAD